MAVTNDSPQIPVLILLPLALSESAQNPADFGRILNRREFCLTDISIPILDGYLIGINRKMQDKS